MLPTGVGEVIEISGMSSDSGQAALGTRPYSSSNSRSSCASSSSSASSSESDESEIEVKIDLFDKAEVFLSLSLIMS